MRWSTFFHAGLIATFLLLLAVVVSAHVFDVRVLHDIASGFSRARSLIDFGHFEWQGPRFFQHYTLGPLGYLLFSIPLSLSRDIHWQYYFLSFLTFLGVVFFRLGAGHILTNRAAAWLSTLAFASAMVLIHLPIKPTHPYYLPFFFGLYAWSLGGACDRKSWRQIFPWLTAGLCVSLHLSCILLLPATLLALLPHRSERDWFWFVIGILAAMAVNGVTFVQIITGAGESIKPHGLDTASGRFVEFASRILVGWAVGPLVFFGVVSFFFILAMTRYDKLYKAKSIYRSPLLAAVVHWQAAIIIFPILNLIKGSPQIEYFRSFAIWAALVVGVFFDWIFEREGAQPKKVFRLAMIFLIALLVFHTAVFAYVNQTVAMMRLNDQFAISGQLHDLVAVQPDCSCIEERIYNHSPAPWSDNIFQERSDDIFSTLLQYQNPEMMLCRCSRHEAKVFLVVIMPVSFTEQERRLCEPMNAEPALPPFIQGKLRVEVYRQKMPVNFSDHPIESNGI